MGTILWILFGMLVGWALSKIFKPILKIAIKVSIWAIYQIVGVLIWIENKL